MNRPERLDESHIEPGALRGSLRDLARLNRLFGGTALVLNALDRLLAQRRSGDVISIVDAGTGGGDVPRAIVRWARRRGLAARITACDAHPQVADVARTESKGFPEIEIVQADITRLPFAAGRFDIALCSLLLHHLTEPEVRTALAELRRVASLGMVVSDLVRGRLSYWGVTLATTLMTRNPLTLHDGPVSVMRAYTVDEMRRLAMEAGCPDLVLRERPGFRMIGVGPGNVETQAGTLAGTRRERDFKTQTAAR